MLWLKNKTGPHGNSFAKEPGHNAEDAEGSSKQTKSYKTSIDLQQVKFSNILDDTGWLDMLTKSKDMGAHMAQLDAPHCDHQAHRQARKNNAKKGAELKSLNLKGPQAEGRQAKGRQAKGRQIRHQDGGRQAGGKQAEGPG